VQLRVSAKLLVLLPAIWLFASPAAAAGLPCWIDHVTISAGHARIYFIDTGGWILNAHVFQGAERFKGDVYGILNKRVEKGVIGQPFGKGQAKNYLEIDKSDHVDVSQLHSGCSLTMKEGGVQVEAVDSLPGLPEQKISQFIPATDSADR